MRRDPALRSRRHQQHRESRDEQRESDWLSTWQHVYDTYHQSARRDALGEDFTGWDSSYDGSPIPLAHMREWRDAAVERILSLKPRRLLEIGVGSGALMGRLAPDCQSFVGTDLSPVAISGLSAQVTAHPELRRGVELRPQPAHDTNGLRPESFDTVVLNSVVQYFPSGEYLDEVLSVAVDLTAPGGADFVGDVRNLRLHRCLLSAVQARRSEENADRQTLRRAVDRAVATENELLVDPGYFTDLATRHRDVAAVDIQVKQAVHENELSRYRYDVVLTKASSRGSTGLLGRLTGGRRSAGASRFLAARRRSRGPVG
ncbi:class I SAM-dependent methyltransferase [Streptomyces sp. NBC_01217]|uniref:class I SAM-dependent methyltransferase n=1 Tax=Streptomyces sp. NBC_01217 TaxID=2903779 RepID=UPI002E103C5B|nr:class I SAM-dependent methyltransferase [Streptomyces sp. NBC_01217]